MNSTSSHPSDSREFLLSEITADFTLGGGIKLPGSTVNRFYVKDNQVIYQKQEALYIMNLNGSGQKRLVAGGVKNFNVAGRWIVYSERDNTNFGAKVALVSIDGSKNVKLPD